MCVSNSRTAVLKTLLHLTWGFSEMHTVAFSLPIYLHLCRPNAQLGVACYS